MTITIDYEDFHQSQQELIWFNKDNNSNIEINQVRVFIKNQFIEALDIKIDSISNPSFIVCFVSSEICFPLESIKL